MDKKNLFFLILLLVGAIVAIIVFCASASTAARVTRGQAYEDNERYVEQNYTISGCEPVNADDTAQHPYGYCQFEEGAGDIRVLLLGDMYALTDAAYYFKHFKLRYDQFRVFTAEGFSPLIPELQPNELNKMQEVVKSFRPNVVIIDQDFTYQRGVSVVGLSEDVSVAYRRSIHFLTSHNVSKVIIIGPRPGPVPGKLELLQEYIKQGNDVPKEPFSWLLAHVRGLALPRIRELSADGATVVNLSEEFIYDTVPERELRFFDPQTLQSFFDSNVCLTEHGAEHAARMFDHIAEIAMNPEEVTGNDSMDN